MGIIFAAIPGLTVTMAIGVMVPITFGMSPDNGMGPFAGHLYGWALRRADLRHLA